MRDTAGTVIHTGYPVNPQYTPEVDSEVAAYVEFGTLLSNEAAREIAAWYQAPTPAGHPFAVFASSGQVTDTLMSEITSLITDARVTATDVSTYPMMGDHEDQLEALLAHVLSYFATDETDDDAI